MRINENKKFIQEIKILHIYIDQVILGTVLGAVLGMSCVFTNIFEFL